MLMLLHLFNPLFPLVVVSDAAPPIVWCPNGGGSACDFENGLCDWTAVGDNDGLDWTRLSGQTETDETGPSQDHTTGTPAGHYLYIEANDRNPGDEAVLESPALTGVASGSLSFW
jgi:hypothetical protein